MDSSLTRRERILRAPEKAPVEKVAGRRRTLESVTDKMGPLAQKAAEAAWESEESSSSESRGKSEEPGQAKSPRLQKYLPPREEGRHPEDGNVLQVGDDGLEGVRSDARCRCAQEGPPRLDHGRGSDGLLQSLQGHPAHRGDKVIAFSAQLQQDGKPEAPPCLEVDEGVAQAPQSIQYCLIKETHLICKSRRLIRA